MTQIHSSTVFLTRVMYGTAVQAMQNMLHTQGGVRLSCTNIDSTAVNSFPIMWCLSWHRSPAAQGMVQTAVRAIVSSGCMLILNLPRVAICAL